MSTCEISASFDFRRRWTRRSLAELELSLLGEACPRRAPDYSSTCPSGYDNCILLFIVMLLVLCGPGALE